ncbi:transcription-repair coupling factor [Microvirga guangxiensis]|uniref:Transcription-repair-coupling factor n=1 Tax=Microvirga guangxiensis TaxID=549386 RepID=A0A1G5IA62_9HYPH|nr:DEAD/DEAH box helicase [Microvirga guangxiensis]SCY73016.1 transcription-repair coupling factor (superfamily II helicase) [Microvirga guangxiensis]
MRAKPVGPPDMGPSFLSLVSSIGLRAVRLIEMVEEAGPSRLIYIAQEQRLAEQMAKAVKGLAPDLKVLLLPPWDCLPYDSVSPSREMMGQRMASLREMTSVEDQAGVLITSPAAVVQRVPPRDIWDGATLTLMMGSAYSYEELQDFLSRAGYILDDRVDEPGEAAIHGQVVDLFPADSLLPYRVEHDGTSIIAIRRYDPITQRTEDEVQSVTLGPASEVVSLKGEDDAHLERSSGMEHRLSDYYDRLETVFDYWPQAALVMEEGAEERRQDVMGQVADAFESRRSLRKGADNAAKPESLFILDDEWQDLLSERRVTIIRPTPMNEKVAIPFFAGSRKPTQTMLEFVREQRDSGHRILLVATTDRDLARLRRRIQSLQSGTIAIEKWKDILSGPPHGIFAIKAEIKGGFVDEMSNVVVVTAYDVFGSRSICEDPSGASSAAAQFTDMSFQIGDTIVHSEHGIGRLDGIETITLNEEQYEDAIRLSYADDAALMVPVTEMDSIWRYGGSSEAVKPDKLNGGAWISRRQKIEAEIREAVQRVKALVSERKSTEVEPIVPPPRIYERFAARFAFTETSDQSRAIEEVLQDLVSGYPMDRLVCGDVGFGKTEVALRAAAAIALSGKQVAIVAPTTVLARQHLRTFQRRFAGLGVEIAHLSRLVAPAEARAVKKGLADGTIRIVVGTHALAGKGIAFKDLGLVVIDEEQRFGVAHKTRLRELSKSGHVLALTATPIPRTFQSSLVGLQDISVIATPPARRQPIRTFLTAFDPASMREALMREKRRNGQSFVVCSRIEDIEPMRQQLEKLVPELKLMVAHGQMSPVETDEAMVGFADGEGDVLLATNIIESGLDVPRANTMLVWRADRFGLAQLHQLRGRVGRGRIRGTVYLLTERDQVLPKVTEKRLRTLEALDRLGAGFAISAQDLDQRGAGSLLEEEQAGHVKLIGTDLYRSMLQRALCGQSMEDLWSPELNLGLSARIPEDYVADPETRINLYARIARLDPFESVDDLSAEIEDRFGAMPQSVQNLISLAEVKQLCLHLGVVRIDAGPQAIAFSFKPWGSNRLPFEEAATGFEDELRWNGERLILARSLERADERLKPILQLLNNLT